MTDVHRPNKPTTTLKSVNSQRDRRWTLTVYDQHKSSRFPRGRPWWGHVERPSDAANDSAFVCELTPGDTEDPFNSTWSAPWLPEQVRTVTQANYFRLDMKLQKITWLYQAIITEDKAATKRYYEAAAKLCNANGWRVPELNTPVSFQVHAILLDPPRSYKIAEAAMAGDPWILGQTDQVNRELDAILKGTVVQNDLREPLVRVDDMLSSDPRIQAMVKEQVAVALAAFAAQLDAKEAEKAAKAKARIAPAQAAQAKKKAAAKTNPSAAPQGAAA